MKIFKVKESCQDCNGTGLYNGMGERDGYAVQCHKCKGTGCYHFVYEYEEFKERKERKDIRMVIESNPSICVGGHLDFGGVSYEEWKKQKAFPLKSEMREYCCPAWWYQSVDYTKKPSWTECIGCGSFSQCQRFPCKLGCWEKWDKENKEGKCEK